MEFFFSAVVIPFFPFFLSVAVTSSLRTAVTAAIMLGLSSCSIAPENDDFSCTVIMHSFYLVYVEISFENALVSTYVSVNR